MADLDDGILEAVETPEQEVESPPTVEQEQPVPAEAQAEPEQADEEPEKPRRRQRSENYREIRAERDALRKLVELQQQQQPQTQQREEASAPKREDFADYEDFLEARAVFAAEQRFQGLQQQQYEMQRQAAYQAEQAEQSARWKQSNDAAIDRYGDDYEDLMEVVGTSINDGQAEAIREADNPAEVVYYLGKHPKEFAAFKTMSPRKAAIAVGRYEATIQAQQAQQSKAPKPTSPVRPSAQTNNRLRDDMPIDQWMKLRNKEVYGG